MCEARRWWWDILIGAGLRLLRNLEGVRMYWLVCLVFMFVGVRRRGVLRIVWSVGIVVVVILALLAVVLHKSQKLV